MIKDPELLPTLIQRRSGLLFDDLGRMDRPWHQCAEKRIGLDLPIPLAQLKIRERECGACKNSETGQGQTLRCGLTGGLLRDAEGKPVILASYEAPCPRMRPGFMNAPIDRAKIKVSVCLATLNEGLDLEATIGLIASSKRKPDEIIVVDDGSRARIERRLIPWIESPEIVCKLIRNSNRTGSGPAKQLAIDRALGDLIVVVDPHMRMPWDWLDLILDAYEQNPMSILTTCSEHFEGAWIGNTVSLKWDAEKVNFEPKWETINDSLRMIRYQPTPAPYGACYVIPRAVLQRIGGYAPLLRGYGNEEEWLGWRAWITGMDVRCIRDLTVQHNYTRQIDRHDSTRKPDPVWLQFINRAIILWTVFKDPNSFKCIYRPLLEWAMKGHGCAERDIKQFDRTFEDISGHMRDFKRGLEDRRLRDDSEIMRIFGIKHPDFSHHSPVN